MLEFAQYAVNGISLGSVYAVVAVGFGLVFSVLRVVNLAHPDVMMIATYLTLGLSAPLLLQLPAAPVLVMAILLVLAMLVTAGIGVGIQRVVLQPLRGRYVLIPMIATAGVSIVLQNVAQRIFGPDPIPVKPIFPIQVYSIGGVIVDSSQVFVFVTAGVLLTVFVYYIRGTRWGRATRAVAERAEVAAASGVNVNLVSSSAVALSSAAAGAAGVALSQLLGVTYPTVGLLFGLKSFVCMLVAGDRRLEGIMVAGLLLGLLESFVAGYLSSNYRDAVAFGLLLLVLFFRPEGLFGSFEVEE
jgi:branched-chain amino acid transport system permease protein